MSTLLKPITAASAALALVLAAGLPAAAQQQPGATPPAAAPQPAPGGEAAAVDDATLQAFAKASLEVEELSSEWAPRLQQAGSEQEAQQLRAEANAEMVKVVESEGLDVETYNRVFQAAQADPQLASAIQQHRSQAQ